MRRWLNIRMKIPGFRVTAIGRILLVLCVFSTFMCRYSGQVRISDIRLQMNRIIGNVDRDYRNMVKVKDMRVGKTGYLYVISKNGRVIVHPQEALVGYSFIDNPLIKTILKMKSGCILQDLEGRRRYVFFRPVADQGFLCLSISTDDLDHSTGNIMCSEL